MDVWKGGVLLYEHKIELVYLPSYPFYIISSVFLQSLLSSFIEYSPRLGPCKEYSWGVFVLGDIL